MEWTRANEDVQTPIYFPDNAELVINIWRMTDERKVWYEWLVESYVVVPPGRKVRLGSSELHSSRKNGCLM